VRLAPGMKSPIILTLTADKEGIAECEIRVFEVSTKMEQRRTIRASIVPVKLYKDLRNELTAQGKSVYAEGVTGIGQELSSKEFFSDSKLNEDEVVDVKSMPWVHGTYYDPWEKIFCSDDKLLEVVVDPNRSQQECIEVWIHTCDNSLLSCKH
jgi:hypothetical protein